MPHDASWNCFIADSPPFFLQPLGRRIDLDSYYKAIVAPGNFQDLEPAQSVLLCVF